MERTGIREQAKVSMFTIAEPGTSSADGYEFWIFLPEQIPSAWDELQPFVETALRHAHGEMLSADIKNLLLQGAFAAFAVVRYGKIQLVFICELCGWQQYSSVRILLLAGKELAQAIRFFPVFQSWVLSKGAVEIEAWTRPSMSRMLRSLGFNKSYDVVRFDLRSKLQ